MMADQHDLEKKLEFQEFVCNSVSSFSKKWTENLAENLKIQFASFETIITGLQSSMSIGLKNLETSLNAKFDGALADATEAKRLANQNATEITELKTEINVMKRDYKLLKQENIDLKIHTNNIECYSRRDNLIFHGIKEGASESTKMCWDAVKVFLQTTLQIPEERVNAIRYVRCHRMYAGRGGGGDRPIIVRFCEFRDRELIWSNLDKLPKKGKYFVSEDYPKAITANRKKMLPIFYRARSTVGKSQVKLRNDVLTITTDNKATNYNVHNISSLSGELNPRCFTRKSSYDVIVFGGSLSEYECLSNWGKFPVTYNGIRYRTLEHAFVHIKCVTNGDELAAEAVLDAREAFEVKQISDRLKLDKKIWTTTKSEDVMSKLLRAKFAKGTELATELLQTGNKHLAESGRDKLYACGLPLTHSDVLNKTAHTGKNRLGHLLMRIRGDLRKK